jgi:AcrR family transcriptional regulator
MTAVDGRVQRGTRNREAIIDALLSCYEDGVIRPSVAEVASRAGISTRSVHNHFEDVEALRAEVAQRQWARYAHLADPPPANEPLPSRVRLLVEGRSALFEAVTPVRRAALLSVHGSPSIARNLARLDRFLRSQLAEVFPGLDADRLEAVDALVSWDMWNRLRRAQGCSAARARRVLVTAIQTLIDQPVLEGSAR